MGERILAAMAAATKTLLLRDRPICECELADRLFTRARGLLGRRELPRGRGMLIRPTWSVHTLFMRFPIDVVFLDRQLQVLRVRENLGAWWGASKMGAHAVLELPAGECERLGLGVDDRLAWAGDA